MPDQLSDSAIEVMLKEYDTLRSEIDMRIKTAFSHIGYIAAVAAFILPILLKDGAHIIDRWDNRLALGSAIVGVILLALIALTNFRWVQECAFRIRQIEVRINAHFGETILHWQHHAESVKALFVLLPPKRLAASSIAEKIAGASRPQ